jgi:hypothetical protein
MKRTLTLLIAGALWVACAGPPALKPLPPAAADQTLDRCRSLFADHDWRLVHTIAAELPGAQTRTVIGVSLVSPAQRSIQAVLMTVEGVILFDATYAAGAVDVHRALPPFDSEAFASGLMQDVHLLFLAPDTAAFESGRLESEGPACRFVRKDGRTLDIVPEADGRWHLSLYEGRRLLRQVRAEACGWAPRIPCRLELTAQGRLSYHLEMSLIEAQPLQSHPAETE